MTAGHPQCNSQAEVTKKTIAKHLTSSVNDSNLNWEPYLYPLICAILLASMCPSITPHSFIHLVWKPNKLHCLYKSCHENATQIPPWIILFDTYSWPEVWLTRTKNATTHTTDQANKVTKSTTSLPARSTSAAR